MSNTDFFQIAALKVFAELGQLIEDDDMRRDAPASLHRLVPCVADDSKQTTILDLPTDIIHNQKSKYLLKDKSMDKIFNKKDDYYLLNFLCGKIWDVKYIGTYSWNEYTTNINLDCIKNYNNSKFNFSCNELKVIFQVSKKITYEAVIINMYNNENKLGCFNKIVCVELKFIIK